MQPCLATVLTKVLLAKLSCPDEPFKFMSQSAQVSSEGVSRINFPKRSVANCQVDK